MLKIKAMTMYIGLSVLVGLIAKARGRGGLRWMVISMLITPIFAGALVLLLKAGSGPQNPLA